MAGLRAGSAGGYSPVAYRRLTRSARRFGPTVFGKATPRQMLRPWGLCVRPEQARRF